MTLQPTAPPAPEIPIFSSLVGTPTPPVEVQTPSGQRIQVMGPGEEAFYVGQAKRYQDENSFTNTSDLLDLDRLLFLELRCYRMSRWLGSGLDYDANIIDQTSCQRILKESSDLISKVKNDLGLNKSARDKSTEHDVGEYLVSLRHRALQFMIHRSKQMTAAISLMKQFLSIVGAFDRADEIERGKLGFPDEEAVLDWVRTVMKPEFDALDEWFRTNPDGQKAWVRGI